MLDRRCIDELAYSFHTHAKMMTFFRQLTAPSKLLDSRLISVWRFFSRRNPLMKETFLRIRSETRYETQIIWLFYTQGHIREVMPLLDLKWVTSFR